MVDGSVRTCNPMPSPNASRPSECDYLQQSLDFEDNFGFASPSIKLTNFGTALGAFEIDECGPYCYKKNLTVNVDIVGGGAQAGQQGEVIVEFPAAGADLPITTAIGRGMYAWILLDGPTAPPFKINGQVILETPTGISVGTATKTLAYQNWLLWQQAEFKGTVAATTFTGSTDNVTGIGFRITSAPAAGQEWHGVAYIDHLQLRVGGGADNPTDAGAYPYGL